MRFLFARVGTFFITFLLAATAGAAEAPIAFSTSGGDAWTFRKPVEINVTGGRCDQIAITSPVATIVAAPLDGHVKAEVPLAPGDNRIEAECRTQDGARIAAAQQTWHVRLRNNPKAVIQASEQEGAVLLDASASEPAPAQGSPINQFEWRAENGNPAALPGLPAQGARLVLPGATADGEYRVTVKAIDAAGRADESTTLFRVRDGRARMVDPVREHAGWIDRAVVYGVVPQLFGPRGLADVTAHLDRLAALGVNTLWLAPITASPPGDFGYAVTDYFRVRPELGDSNDLRALIGAAHVRGLRVIMDFVPNHLSEQHAYFADTALHAHASAYFEFFARAKDGSAEHYFDWSNLKNLNYKNPEVQRLVIEAFAHWVREFDIDGFRIDAAWGPKERAPEFWPRWRTELKRIKPDLLLLAEASARDSYYGENGFDAAYDWTDKLGEWAWQQAFASEMNIAGTLRDAIAASSGKALVFRFLDNNDTGARFITRHGVERTKVASAMLLTLLGIPGLYTGEEVGAAYEPYSSLKPITWSDDTGLQSWYARLIALRRDEPALRSRDIRMLDVAPADRVLAYVRPGATPAENIVVLLNFSREPTHITLTDEMLDVIGGRYFVDRLNGGSLVLDREHNALSLAGHAVRILKPQ
jgi:glycosidase